MGVATVVAIRDFVYRDKAIYAGDSVTMEPLEAAVAAQRGDVDLNARPTYQTRDMQAAPVGAMTTTPSPAPVEETPTPPKKRRRRRTKTLA